MSESPSPEPSVRPLPETLTRPFGPPSPTRGEGNWKQLSVTCVHLSKNGQIVVSGSSDKTVRVWGVSSGDSITLQGHEKKVTSVQLSNDGAIVFSGSEDKTVRVWNVQKKESLKVIHFSEQINSISLHDNLGILCIGAEDGSVLLWQCIDKLNQIWQFRWTSNYPNLALHLHGCDVTSVKGLSCNNRRLLQQHGAFVDTNEVLEEQVQEPIENPLEVFDSSEQNVACAGIGSLFFGLGELGNTPPKRNSWGENSKFSFLTRDSGDQSEEESSELSFMSDLK